MTIDTGSTSFSVLIPAISLAAISDHKTLATEAIVTSHTGPNSVPSTGVHETYQFIPLKGEASFVLALLEPTMGALAKATLAAAPRLLGAPEGAFQPARDFSPAALLGRICSGRTA